MLFRHHCDPMGQSKLQNIHDCSSIHPNQLVLLVKNVVSHFFNISLMMSQRTWMFVFLNSSASSGLYEKATRLCFFPPQTPWMLLHQQKRGLRKTKNEEKRVYYAMKLLACGYGTVCNHVYIIFERLERRMPLDQLMRGRRFRGGKSSTFVHAAA